MRLDSEFPPHTAIYHTYPLYTALSGLVVLFSYSSHCSVWEAPTWQRFFTFVSGRQLLQKKNQNKFFGACERASLPPQKAYWTRLRLLCRLICLRNTFSAIRQVWPAPKSSLSLQPSEIIATTAIIPHTYIHLFSAKLLSFLYHPNRCTHGKLVTKSSSITPGTVVYHCTHLNQQLSPTHSSRISSRIPLPHHPRSLSA